MIGYIVAIAAVLLIVGVIWADRGGSYYSILGWPSWTPNYGGVALAVASCVVLAAIGLMKLGAWLW